MAETATVEIQMPAMGESVSEGTVLEWHVSEGETVEEGQTVVEVSTDKVDAEVPAPASGKITKILAQADEEVQVGQALAEMASGDGAGSGAETAEQADTDPGTPGSGPEDVPGGDSGEAAGNGSDPAESA